MPTNIAGKGLKHKSTYMYQSMSGEYQKLSVWLAVNLSLFSVYV